MVNKLKLGIPKGSLEEATIALFEKSGWQIRTHSRNYFPSIDDPEISCALVRAQEMPRYVQDGTLDVGLTGKDWLLENNADVEVVCDLIYSKSSKKPARWVVAVNGDSKIEKLSDLEGKKISTELVRYTQSYFKERGIHVEVEFSWGATEAKAVEGLVDAIVEITETESTIRAHGLKIIHEMMQTNTQLVAGRKAWADPWKRQKIEQIAILLQSALRAERMVGLKMNVSKQKLGDLVKILPSITAPTISTLYQSDWFSVETVISEEKVRELIPRLIRQGAEGIIEYSLNKLI
ncbi:MAG: ATP phosphoribosyltransferase [Nitrospirae bacterium CG08_land_8_20_14_0_20_52_24]|nr:MAG: ATP phosphoribosyltransferase [Nitrospirae bacterium CG08_land_8_20_14_0_20_52_24]PIV84847.1 MAG: ATP phosphoribosyltransferase [Nitrospirae bacterium CG17_big_fil_post_rev_8_21_14_2_50_50_9]PIW85711.1 MAG: ATP phosphoribosyltransferase [Nitrospirae bacterium CG_4_8_14_3_um_filter_50_41]PIX86406.1 MAG: ATP phosphoribosyltransferase [Nitrospirae bacterium CG_4_10_14_3_um_filter_53_41]